MSLVRLGSIRKGAWVLPRISLVLGPSSPVFKEQRDEKRKEKRYEHSILAK